MTPSRRDAAYARAGAEYLVREHRWRRRLLRLFWPTLADRLDEMLYAVDHKPLS